ncbi:MAG: hypothetical protein E3K37_12410 [Candidatus Kuenenia sp.]|nr:hypothetical protein [Candidatus Kuenenia hertensis]
MDILGQPVKVRPQYLRVIIMPYPIIEIKNNDQIEPLGTKEKFWFYDEKEKIKKLFKVGRIKTGENWSEKIACELAKRLDLPCANYDFAIWNNKEGVVTPNFVPKNGRLILGNEILAKIVDNYPRYDFYKVREYRLSTVLAIMLKLKNINLPIGYIENNIINNSIGMFIGYLLFDCWISNPDRHHENWGFILDSSSNKIHLTPTYDHASGLGCRLTDEERKKKLNTKDKGYSVSNFVKRAITPFFDKEKKQMKTIETFFIASRHDSKAALFWLEN